MSLLTFQMTNYKCTRSIYPGDGAKLAKESKNLKELRRNYHVIDCIMQKYMQYFDRTFTISS